MALQSITPAAKGAPARRADDKDRVPVEIPRDRWGRPEILQPDGTRVGYTRASGLGKVLEDDTAITRWKLRVVVWGLARRPDLILRAQSIAGTEERDQKKDLDELVQLALDTGGAGSKARIGTALHALTELVDRGERLPDVGMHRYALDAYAAVMTSLFEVLDSEVFIVHDRLRTAGTFDRRVRTRAWMQPCDNAGRPVGQPLPPGTVLVLDLKTSGTADYFGIAFAVQTAVYDGGELYDPATGLRTPLETHGGWALILHVPSGGNVAELHWVDLDAGRALADLAVSVKAERAGARQLVRRAVVEPLQPGEVCAKHGAHPGTVDCVDCIYTDGNTSGAPVPASPSPPPAAPRPTFAGQIFDTVKTQHDYRKLMELIGQCLTEAALLELYRTNWRIWTDAHTTRAGECSAFLAAQQAAS